MASDKHSTFSLRDLFNQVLCDKIIIPDFQRNYVWRPEKLIELLASVFCGMPISTCILLLEGNQNEFSSKRVCFSKKDEFANSTATEFLLDGQQRLASLVAAFCDLHSQEALKHYYPDKGYNKTTLREHNTNLYSRLRNRWFIDLNPEGSIVDGTVMTDPFGFHDLSFPEDFTAFEPSSIVPHITSRSLTSAESQHSPLAVLETRGNKVTVSERKKNDQFKYFAENNLIPLWELGRFWELGRSKGRTAHQEVIRKIAEQKAEEIRDGILDGMEISEKLMEALSNQFHSIENSDFEYVEELVEQIKSARQGLEVENLTELESQLNEVVTLAASNWQHEFMLYLNQILDNFKIPVITLGQNELSRAISIFETINKGGTPLQVFDLLVAKYSRVDNEKNLIERMKDAVNIPLKLSDAVWCYNRGPRPDHVLPINFGIMDKGQSEFGTTFQRMVVNLISLCHYHKTNNGVANLNPSHLKKDYALNIPAEDMPEALEDAQLAFARASAFLQMRCGVTDIGKLRYELMLVVIGYALLDDDTWNNVQAINRLEAWYWISLFSGRWITRQNEVGVADIRNIHNWTNDLSSTIYSNHVSSILNHPDYSDETAILEISDENSLSTSLGESVSQYVLSCQPLDFLENKTLNAWEVGATLTSNHKNALHEHHIIPLGTAKTLERSAKDIRNDKTHILNSPANKTYILSSSNLKISDKDTPTYMADFRDFNLDSHFFPADAKMKFLSQSHGDKDTFFKEMVAARFKELKRAISLEVTQLISN